MSEKGKKKIIKPKGDQLIDYLNKGAAICNKCGAVMDLKKNPDEEVFGELICPACGWNIGEDEYEYDDGDPLKDGISGDIPEGCAACGGPYPSCRESCPIFDD